MKTIGELLTRDLSRKIEEITQVDQGDQESVYSEITEYVATDSIRGHYATLLRAIAEAPAEPYEGIGVWISGFFGSGKSSFAKNLGYALQNQKVLDHDFASLFKGQIGDQRVSDLVDLINAKIPTDVVLFDVSKQNDIRTVTERLAEKIYTVVLRELGYAEDFEIAELEIELESEGLLSEFEQTCRKLHNKDWRIVRKGAQKLSRASAVLHALNPKTYPSADSWSHAQGKKTLVVTVAMVVERTFELMSRRRPGRALFFVIDEVGQHVARSGDKIEDLRATVEEFGKVGKNLLKARKIVAPCWIVVTSQEKLDEVVAAIDSKRVELAKLQDRFRYHVDLAPSDIREVATKRVLAKKEDAEPVLKKMFTENQGSLNAALRLEQTTRPTEITEADFVRFYPYPPHYIDLCIGIMSGIRLQPGALRHYGGSNRTIIKQAYEMLVNDRTAVAKKPVGTLITLDKVYELVEGNLSSEKRRDIYEISQRIKEPDGEGWALRVAKVICLLEFLRDLPRTEANIAAFLVDEVGQQAPLAQVKAALKRLQAAQFVRNTEEGWKLQTAQEKNWETKRRSFLDPKQRERNEIIGPGLEKIFDEAEFKTYRYQNLRTFRIGVGFEGKHAADEGELPLTLCVAEDADDLTRKLAEVREDSRQNSHQNDVYWVFALSPEIDQLVAELHASRKMVNEYDQLRAQHKITTDEGTCLQGEKNAVLGYQNRLRDKLTEATERGTGLFRGVARDASALGKSLGEILKKMFGQVVPDLYPKLEMGSRSLKGDEAELVLKAVDLKALPQVFYAGENGLGVVVKDGPKFVVNTAAEIVKEVFDYLKSEQSYGNKESRMGKALEKRFCGTGYGWERDMLRLVLAVLFRSGEIEVTYQGNRFHGYQDPFARTPFTSNPAFRNSLFSPRQSLGLKALTQAVQQLEDITGEEVDVEEGAIATAFKKVASEELEKLYPLKALADAHQLPVIGLLSEYQQTLLGIQASAPDDCVRLLNETGPLLQQSRDKIHHVRDVLNEKTIALLRQARQATGPLWQRLGSRNPAPELAEGVEQLKGLLGSEQVLDLLDAIKVHTRTLNDAYKTAYLDLFDRRAAVYESAIEEIKNRPEWQPIATTNQAVADTLLAPLRARVGSKDDRDQVGSGTSLGHSSLAEMESDLAAVEGLRSSVLVALRELAYGGEEKAPVRRVKVSNLFHRPIENQDDLEAAIEQLRDALQKYLDEGAAVILE